MNECCGNCEHWRWIEDLYDDGTYIESNYCMMDHDAYRDTEYNSPPCCDFKCVNKPLY